MPRRRRRRVLPRNVGPTSADLDLTAERAAPVLLNLARIYAAPREPRCLDPTELARLEDTFRTWVKSSTRYDVRSSRTRILLIFLLIRYTGARLNEVLALDLRKDFYPAQGIIRYAEGDNSTGREVQISSELVSEIREAMDDPAFAGQAGSLLKVDAAHVRRKFYERARACGFPQELGSPNALRKARAVEMMKSSLPLPVVQRILGHANPSLTASFVAFSEKDIRQVEKHFVERESKRKTSARNTFFGKIGAIQKGDIQSRIDLFTLDGDVITTVITNNSLERLGLKLGSLATAEVKAPWVVLQKMDTAPTCSAENIFRGTVTQIRRGKLTSEFIVHVREGTELCSLMTEESRRKLTIGHDDQVWAIFNSFAVILRVE